MWGGGGGVQSMRLPVPCPCPGLKETWEGHNIIPVIAPLSVYLWNPRFDCVNATNFNALIRCFWFLNKTIFGLNWIFFSCFFVSAFVDLLHSSHGTTQSAQDRGTFPEHSKHEKGSKKGKNKIHVVPSHLTKTDVSGIKEETLIFTNMMFCIRLSLPAYYFIFFLWNSREKKFSRPSLRASLNSYW